MTAPVLIFGTGGHARDVAQVVHALGRTPVLIARDPVAGDRAATAHPVVSEAEAVATPDADFAIGIGEAQARARVAAAYPALRFPVLVHPDTSLAHDRATALADARGTIVFAGVRIMAGVTVGAFCVFNLNATVSHDCKIGDFATLSPGATVAGNVRIGAGAWIGAGAVINQGTDVRKRVVGARTVIGSGTVVLGDCAADSVYVGNPARKLR